MVRTTRPLHERMGHPPSTIPVTKPRALKTIAIHVKPGRYRLWCSLADHRALRMQTVLRVRRR
jgi:hypothetical protein